MLSDPLATPSDRVEVPSDGFYLVGLNRVGPRFAAVPPSRETRVTSDPLSVASRRGQQVSSD